jgi:hypothetical protein
MGCRIGVMRFRGKSEREVMHACRSGVREHRRWVRYGRVVSHVDGTVRWASGEAGIVFESKLIEELSRWWPDILAVPCLVEGGMVAGFCVAAGEVKVANVLVSRGVPKEQSGKVVFVEFGALISCLLHADTRTKEFEVLEVWFDAPPTFERGDTGTGVDTTIVEVGCMEQRS